MSVHWLKFSSFVIFSVKPSMSPPGIVMYPTRNIAIALCIPLCTPWCCMNLSACLPFPQFLSSLSSRILLFMHWEEWREEDDRHVLSCGGDLLPLFLIQVSLPITMYDFPRWFFSCPSEVLSLLISKTQRASVASALLSDLAWHPFLRLLLMSWLIQGRLFSLFEDLFSLLCEMGI